MCGILGYKIFKNDTFGFKQNKKQFFKSIENRGPDSQGSWENSDKSLQIFNTRLKIQDQSEAANMPMLSQCKNYIISYNGELFNKNELIEKYINKKKLITNSDTEVILLLYTNYKEKMLNLLDGMYSISIYSCADDSLFIARDPLGIKPLYYTYNNDYFYFSSAIKSFFFKKKVSQEALVDFFSLGFIRDPHTILEEVYSLEPGYFLLIKNQKIIKTQFVNLLTLFKQKKVNSNIAQNIEKSIIKHYTSEVSSCLFLSSGIDSNIILSTFIKNKINIPTISISFENNKYEKNIKNELDLVKQICKQHKIDNISKIITQDDVKYFDNLFYQSMDQPSTDGLNTFIISYFAKENNFKVAYSGLGGDELFCDYGTYRKIKIISKINQIIKSLGLKNIINFIFKNLKFKNPKFQELFCYSEIDQIYFLVRSLFSKNEKISFLDKKIDLLKFNNNLEKVNENAYLTTAYFEYKIYLQNQLLRDSDWTSMHNSLELRVPFANPKLIEDAFQIIPLITRHEILKNLNPKIYSLIKFQKKIGFYMPTYIKSNYHNPLKTRSLELLKKYIDLNNLII